jgi:hypothetical protein
MFSSVSANIPVGIFRNIFEDFGNSYILVGLAVVAASELELLYDWRFTAKELILAQNQRLFFATELLRS